MTDKRGYSVFPTTFKARLLLGLAFSGGLVMMASYFAIFLIAPLGFVGPLDFTDWFDEIDVTYVNRTDETLAVYLDDDLQVTVHPETEVTVGYRKIEWWWHRDLEVRDLNGNLISATRYDKDDLEDIDYRIVIDESGF